MKLGCGRDRRNIQATFLPAFHALEQEASPKHWQLEDLEDSIVLPRVGEVIEQCQAPERRNLVTLCYTSLVTPALVTPYVDASCLRTPQTAPTVPVTGDLVTGQGEGVALHL